MLTTSTPAAFSAVNDGRRRAEVVVLAGHGLAALGDRGLQVDHREVGAGQHRRDRARARPCGSAFSWSASTGKPVDMTPGSVSCTSGNCTSPANANVTACPLPRAPARPARSWRRPDAGRVVGAFEGSRHGGRRHGDRLVTVVVVARDEHEERGDTHHDQHENRDPMSSHPGTISALRLSRSSGTTPG